jgi:2-keto-4-pentenoate hydratase
MGGLELEMTGARGDQDKQTVRCFVYTVSMRLSSNGGAFGGRKQRRRIITLSVS